MMESNEKVVQLFCDARIDKSNPLLMHIGVVAVVSSVQSNFIKPEYVHSYYQTNRIARSVSEAPFYELFSIAEGLAYLARVEKETPNIIVYNDCSGTIDLLSRLGATGSGLSFKHKSLYLECLGENYNSGIKFNWLSRKHKAIALADFVGRCNNVLEIEELPLAEKFYALKAEVLSSKFDISALL